MYSPMKFFVGTNMNQRVSVIYATFWDRLWASLIDSLVLSVLILAVILFIFNVFDVDVAITVDTSISLIYLYHFALLFILEF